MSVGLAVLLWSTGLPTLFRLAEAASITSASDTISESKPSTVANHSIAFTLPNGMVASSTMELTFDAGFTMGSVGEDDVDILVNGLSSSTAAVNAAGVWGVLVTGSVIRFTSPSDVGVASSSPIVIRIGTNAVDFGTGANQITNPSSVNSYPIDIDGGTSATPMQDSGQVRVAIVDQVVVSASVDTSLTFTVGGLSSGATVNTSPTTTVANTTATTLPFGTLPVGSSVTLAQTLSVATNAGSGYTVTVEETGPFDTALGASIDGFINGSNTNTPTAWTGPAGTLGSPDTYGHWGLTSEDLTVPARSGNDFTADTWVAASTSPIAVMGHNGPSDGIQAGSGFTRVGYQVQISALQEAGNDYSTELRYIATPTF
jgi:hypothetical protein